MCLSSPFIPSKHPTSALSRTPVLGGGKVLEDKACMSLSIRCGCSLCGGGVAEPLGVQGYQAHVQRLVGHIEQGAAEGRVRARHDCSKVAQECPLALVTLPPSFLPHYCQPSYPFLSLQCLLLLLIATNFPVLISSSFLVSSLKFLSLLLSSLPFIHPSIHFTLLSLYSSIHHPSPSPTYAPHSTTTPSPPRTPGAHLQLYIMLYPPCPRPSIPPSPPLHVPSASLYDQ